MATDVQAQEVFNRHRRVWAQKPALRGIYHDEFFARLLSFRKKDGPCIEVGGGPGFFKQVLPAVVATDLVWCSWLDAVADAQSLPFRTSSVANVFGLDVLHHLAAPMRFLEEAERVLAPGGRLILIEPWITPFSYLIYRYLHEEDCDLSAQPWDSSDGPLKDKRAFEGNQAIPYLLFAPRHLARTLACVPRLTLVVLEPFCLFAYLLSFGFKSMNLLPQFLYSPIARFERATLPLWRRFAALRVFLVLEKAA